jgi:CBS domain containing-hemolysin-like protein
MDYGDSLERYRGGMGVRNLVTNHLLAVVAALFLVVVGTVIAASLAVGYAEGAAILVAWTVLIGGVVLLFGVLPVFASRYLPVYQNF